MFEFLLCSSSAYATLEAVHDVSHRLVVEELALAAKIFRDHPVAVTATRPDFLRRDAQLY